MPVRGFLFVDCSLAHTKRKLDRSGMAYPVALTSSNNHTEGVEREHRSVFISVTGLVMTVLQKEET